MIWSKFFYIYWIISNSRASRDKVGFSKGSDLFDPRNPHNLIFFYLVDEMKGW